MMIDSIKLNNFKCYKSQYLELKNLNILCGGNSVGKSAIIQSIAAFLQSKDSTDINFEGDIIKLGNYSDIHSNYPDVDNSILLEIGINGKKYSWGYTNENNIDGNTTSYDSKLSRYNGLPLLSNNSADLEPLRKTILNNYQFLIAERLGPRDNYSFSQSLMHKYWVGTQGEYTAQVLYWLSERSDTFDDSTYENIDKRTHHSEPKSNVLIRNIEQWMKEITPEIEFSAQSVTDALVSYTTFQDNGVNIRSVHVGFGLSYALSVVTALICTKPGGLVVIENPEAHLHPRGQSFLGRLIALTAQAGIQVIIETHSEHIINGIRVIIRMDKSYPDNSAKVFFIHKKKKADPPSLEELSFDKNAQLPSWPDGFFDQQLSDMKVLINGKE